MTEPLLGNRMINQLAFVVKDLDAASDAYCKLLGIEKPPVIHSGNFYNGKGRYAYMDTTSTYKVIIELLERFEA